MSDVVRVCVVGMGIGRWNGRALAADPRGRVVALCDLYPERMQDFAKELKEPVKFYTDYKEMCQDPDIDAVMVGTPNQWHVPVALEAVKNGKHVLVTKPLADSEGAARTLVEAAEKAGVVNMMSLSMRFSNTVQYVGKLAQQGFFGDIYYVRSQSIRRIGIPGYLKRAVHFIQKGGGAFRDMGVHYLDSAWWLMGLPTPVSVLGTAGAKFGPRGEAYWHWVGKVDDDYARQFAADDFGGGFIRFANGAGMQIESFWASHQPEGGQVELFGTEAGAKLRPLTLYRTVNGAPQDLAVTVNIEEGESWKNLAAHFIACILDGIPCEAPLRHGLVVQQMMEGLLKSAETGHEVRF
jgi:predicted dehydrogenase